MRVGWMKSASGICRLPRAGILYGLLVLFVLGSALLLATPGEARDAPASLADLVQRLSPAVVNISTSQTLDVPDSDDGTGEQAPDDQGQAAPPFADPFKDQPDDGVPGQPTAPEKVQSLGSGFVIDASGIIVTNNHVIDGADKIDVTFIDGTTLPAKLLGRDDKTDVAVLKIDTKMRLPFVRLGDSSKMRVGDWVLAIGNPFGLGGSVTAGIISALNRDIHAGNYDDFIQTDASINRGNSGGPLFSLSGEVIGMNTAIISPSGESVGIGFATPSSTLISVVAQIVKYGEIRRGWIGVRIQAVTPEIAATLGLAQSHGALVAGITPGGPAEAAGIETGDLIVGFDGQKIREMRDLPRVVAETETGKQAVIDVIRNGKPKSLSIKVARLQEPKVEETTTPVKKPPVMEKTRALGLDLTALTPEVRAHFNLGPDVGGVLISDVESTSAAADKGIRPGDLIIEVGDAVVKTPHDVIARFAEAKKAGRTSVLLRLSTGGKPHFVALPLQ